MRKLQWKWFLLEKQILKWILKSSAMRMMTKQIMMVRDGFLFVNLQVLCYKDFIIAFIICFMTFFYAFQIWITLSSFIYVFSLLTQKKWHPSLRKYIWRTSLFFLHWNVTRFVLFSVLLSCLLWIYYS